MTCPDLIPISSDEESSVPKIQDCSKSSSSEVAGLSHRDMSVANADVDGNISSFPRHQTPRVHRPAIKSKLPSMAAQFAIL